MELCLDQESAMQRVKSADEVVCSLTALQHYAIVRHKLVAK